jgi:hypothetical protein
MSRTVFILGAGASREAGGPLMADFLDRAEDILRRNQAGKMEASFRRVFSAISTLQAVHSKATLDIDNIESVFAAFEMAQLFGGVRGLSMEDVNELPGAIRDVIVRTLERTVPLRVVGPAESIRFIPPVGYDNFAGLVQDMASNQQPVSIITFNYDLALDYGLHFIKVPVDYCISGSSEPRKIALLKLHGSLNWARCGKCRTVLPWLIGNFFTRRQFRLAKPDQPAYLEIASHLEEDVKHCDQPVESRPVIVPPTWNKTQYQQEIAAVWREAARHLSEAENILVIGYSLPPTDQFFRYLYALGTVSDTRLKRFWLFDPAVDRVVGRSEIEQRYASLLGQAAQARFAAFDLKFSQVTVEVRRKLQVPASR